MAGVVRAVTWADVPVLEAHEPPGAGIAASLLAHQDSGRVLYAAAFDGGRPLGAAVLDWGIGRDAKGRVGDPELKHLYVYEDCRGRGVGGRLCRWLEEQARSAGAKTLFLGVAEDNAAAVRLYTRLGYEPTGDTDTTTYTYIDDAGSPHTVTEHSVILRKNF